MKRVLCLIVLIGLPWVAGGTAVAQDQAVNDDQQEAMAVLQSFLDAHIDGQPEVIKRFLGGELLNKRAILLENPAYPDFLRTAYSGMRYKMSDCISLTDDRVQIKVDFDFGDGESKRFRYVLSCNKSVSDGVPSFFIYSQTEIPR